MKLFTRQFVSDIVILSTIVIAFYLLTHNPYTHPREIKEEGVWSIEVMQQPLVLGLAGHNFIIMRNNEGEIVRELHGLPTDKETGTWKYVTTKRTDILRAFEFTSPKDYNTSKHFAGLILMEGNENDIVTIWEKSYPCKEAINKEEIPYPSLGFSVEEATINSNAVAYTLITCMGLSSDHLGLITPGWGNIITYGTTSPVIPQ